MKLIIAGSRTFSDYQRLCQVLAPDRPHITQVLTGGARGADQLGYRWAWKHAIRHQRFRADWERFGRSAGIRRHHQMAQAGAPAGGVLGWATAQAPRTCWCMHALVGQTRRGHPHGGHGIKKRLARVQALHPESARLARTQRLYLNPLTRQGSDHESTTVSHPVPSAQAHAIADLTGYEDAATLRWQQACVQAANTLTALPNGRYVNVRMERMRQGLELAQRAPSACPRMGRT